MSIQGIGAAGRNTIRRFAASAKSSTKPVEKNIPDESKIIFDEILNNPFQKHRHIEPERKMYGDVGFFIDSII